MPVRLPVHCSVVAEDHIVVSQLELLRYAVAVYDCEPKFSPEIVTDSAPDAA